MTTNETPYRPQVGDRVQVLDDGMILMDWGQGKGPYFVKFKDDCYWMPSEEFQLISRADGVPVETNAREKMQQEHAAEVAQLQKDNEEMRIEASDLSCDLSISRKEHAAEVAELKRDLEIARNERNQARLNEQKKWSDVVKSMQDEVDELRKQLAEKTAECEKLSLHAAGFPDKPDWVGQHLQSWIKNKDALVAAANKMAGEELDRRFKTDDVVTDLRQRLERAVQIATESREIFRKIHSYLGWDESVLIGDTLKRINAFLAAESQRTTDGEVDK